MCEELPVRNSAYANFSRRLNNHSKQSNEQITASVHWLSHSDTGRANRGVIRVLSAKSAESGLAPAACEKTGVGPFEIGSLRGRSKIAQTAAR